MDTRSSEESTHSADNMAYESRIIPFPVSENEKVVIIVGAGFAGLSAAKELANVAGIQVILVDQKNHHLFQPLLYQVATAGLNPADIAVPIRAQFNDAKNVRVHMGRIDKVDLKEQLLFVPEGIAIHYDYLILACGAKHSYFGRSEWEEFAPGLKTIEQATEIRRRLLTAFENAENELDPVRRQEFLTFVVVGGGPTGIEMAGAISDISHAVLSRDFKEIDTRSARIVLVEAGSRVLAAFDEKISHRAEADLAAMGVEVLKGVRVTDINADGVQIDGKQFIQAKTVVWAAGVQASKMIVTPEVSRDRSGRIVVTDDFSIPDQKNVFVVGDMAAYTMENNKTLPGLAPVAKQSGRHAALMIKSVLNNKEKYRFQYVDKGLMATIGKRRAVAQVGSLHLSGFIAWVGWLFIHVHYLIGFKNKLAVMVQWSWSYLFEKRGSRLITAREWRLDK